MRILRPTGDGGFVSRTPGEDFFYCLFAGLFALIRFVLVATWRVLVILMRLADRGIRWAWYRYRMRGVMLDEDNVVDFKRHR